ncbi:MAG TPA: hypothetical protein H9762_03400 [Candidatus Ligilactobacillus avistercoris]|nr:hypothetical protein [Candidatus Ligilactobacillus avistercoris]
MEKRSATIDFFRVIAAFLVVIIHSGQVPFHTITVTIALYAVPFFMLVTGYFYFKAPSVEKLRRTLRKVLWLWFIWMIIYLPNAIRVIMRCLVHGINPLHLILWSFFGESICYGGSWYLLAVAFGLFVVDWFRRHNRMGLCHLFALVALVIGCGSTNYRPLMIHLPLMHYYWATTMIVGVLWMDVAFLIAKYEKFVSYFSSWWWVIAAIAVTFAEYLFVSYFTGYSSNLYNDMWLTLPISIAWIFAVILNHPYYKPAKNVMKLRDFATLLFFIHFGVINFGDFSHTVLGCLAAVGCATVITGVVLVLSYTHQFRFLKKIY